MLRILKTTTITDAMVIGSAIAENDHPVYSPSATYALGATVIHNHRRCESLQNDNTGHAPDELDSTWWLDLGPTNRWAVFDNKASTQSVLTTSVGTPAWWVTVAPGICNGLYVQGMTNVASLRVQQVSGGVTVFDKTLTLDDSIVANWYDYYYQPYDIKTDVAVGPFPPYHSSQITLTLSPAAVGTTVKVGNVLFGSTIEMGKMEYGLSVDFKDYSVKSADRWGNYDLVEGDYTSVPGYLLVVRKKDLRRVWAALVAQRAKPTIWQATSDIDLTPFNVYGFLESFSIVLRYHDHIYINCKIQGMT